MHAKRVMVVVTVLARKMAAKVMAAATLAKRAMARTELARRTTAKPLLPCHQHQLLTLQLT